MGPQPLLAGAARAPAGGRAGTQPASGKGAPGTPAAPAPEAATVPCSPTAPAAASPRRRTGGAARAAGPHFVTVEDTRVSRLHCWLRPDAASRSVTVEAVSGNGTWVGAGPRLGPGASAALSAGQPLALVRSVAPLVELGWALHVGDPRRGSRSETFDEYLERDFWLERAGLGGALSPLSSDSEEEEEEEKEEDEVEEEKKGNDEEEGNGGEESEYADAQSMLGSGRGSPREARCAVALREQRPFEKAGNGADCTCSRTHLNPASLSPILPRGGSSAKRLERVPTSKYNDEGSTSLADLRCMVCLGTVTAALALEPCGHTFCAACLSQYFGHRMTAAASDPYGDFEELHCPLR